MEGIGIKDIRSTEKLFANTETLLDSESVKAEIHNNIEALILQKHEANISEQQRVRDGDLTVSSEKEYPMKDLLKDLDKEFGALQETEQKKYDQDIDSLLDHAIENSEDRAIFLNKIATQVEERKEAYLPMDIYHSKEFGMTNSVEAKAQEVIQGIEKDNKQEAAVDTAKHNFLDRMNKMDSFEGAGKMEVWDNFPLTTNGVGNSYYEQILTAERGKESNQLNQETVMNAKELFMENHKDYVGLKDIKGEIITEREAKKSMESLYAEIEQDLKDLSKNKERGMNSLSMTSTDKVFENKESSLVKALNSSNAALEGMEKQANSQEAQKQKESLLEKVSATNKALKSPSNSIEEKMRVQHAKSSNKSLEDSISPKYKESTQSANRQNDTSKNKGRSM